MLVQQPISLEQQQQPVVFQQQQPLTAPLLCSGGPTGVVLAAAGISAEAPLI